MSGNVRLPFRTILKNLRKSSESDRKSSEIRQMRRHQHVYIIKRTLHVSSKIWILYYRGKNYIVLATFLPLEHKIHMFSPPCNILYIYVPCYSFFFSSRPFITNTEMVFPLEQAKYYSPYHFRPTHHVISKSSKKKKDRSCLQRWGIQE